MAGGRQLCWRLIPALIWHFRQYRDDPGVSRPAATRARLSRYPPAIAVCGISKSAVSERFVYGTERKLAELIRRELSGLSLAVLLIDVVHFAEVMAFSERTVMIPAPIDVGAQGRNGVIKAALSSTNLIENLFSRVR